MNYKINIVFLMIAFLSLVSYDGFSQDVNFTSKFSKTLTMGVRYQVQEYQLLNQTIDSDCNCLESLPLSKRSLQTYNLSVYKTVNQRWALGADLGYGSGYTLNDNKQYKSGDFFQTKFDAFFQLFNTGDKLRPYLTTSIQLIFNTNDVLFSVPLGAGLRYRLKNETYLHVQAAYDAGLSTSMAKNLISGIGIHFPLARGKALSVNKFDDEKTNPIINSSLLDSTSLANKKTSEGQEENSSKRELIVKNDAKTLIKDSILISKILDVEKLSSNSKRQISIDSVIAVNKYKVEQKPNQTITQVHKPNQIARIVYFDIDKSLLNKLETEKVLKEVYAYMTKYPESKASLYGHTDGTASLAYNKALSQRRVQSVLNHFVELGILKDRFVLDFFGKLKPATSNASLPGRSSNRRVEIVVK